MFLGLTWSHEVWYTVSKGARGREAGLASRRRAFRVCTNGTVVSPECRNGAPVVVPLPAVESSWEKLPAGAHRLSGCGLMERA